MPYTTLISTEDLAANLTNPNWAIADCRFSLADTEQGHLQYRESHIASAVYAHLDNDLSGPIISGKTSRHPLPEIDVFAQTLSGWGIADNTQVVVYDDLGGAIAARLWWMLRWLGHNAVAVLDGGWPAWQSEDRPVNSGIELRESRKFVPNPRTELLLTANDIKQIRTNSTYRLIDARSADRYRGENETLDPVGGHIPGAVSLPFADNLGGDKKFLPVDQLNTRFRTAIGDTSPEKTVFYCGSGVTAAHNILAMLHAGLGESSLYAGSWSDWITDPNRPVAAG